MRAALLVLFALCALPLGAGQALAMPAAPAERGAAVAMPVAPAERGEALYLEALRLMTEGRQGEATAALERLIAIAPQHAGAWLELAIHHCALGHPAEAERLFREIELRFAPSAGILDVIERHRRRGCQPWQPQVYRAVTLSRGADSNVNQGASNPLFVTGSGPERIESLLADSYLPRRDNYLQAAFDYTRELGQRGASAFVQARARHHDRIREQDTNALLLGAERALDIGGWRARATGSASVVSLAGRLYQRQLQLQARGAVPLPLPPQLELTLSAALANTAYLTRRSFDANSGELAALLNYRGGASQGLVAAGLLADHGEAGRLGGDRHGWYASAQAQHRFGARLDGELGYTRQDWRGQRVYSPGLIEAVRSQSTRQWRAALAVAVAPRHSVQLEWRRVRNLENISLFQYNSRVLQLNWQCSGF